MHDEREDPSQAMRMTIAVRDVAVKGWMQRSQQDDMLLHTKDAHGLDVWHGQAAACLHVPAWQAAEDRLQLLILSVGDNAVSGARDCPNITSRPHVCTCRPSLAQQISQQQQQQQQ